MYTTMHGSLGFWIGTLYYLLFGWIGGFVIAPTMSFLSHLFGADRYPEFYPDGGWGEEYKKIGLKGMFKKYLFLWISIGISFLAQIVLVSLVASKYPMLAIVMAVNWVYANGPDFTEHLLSKQYKSKHFWFVHHGNVPKVPEWMKKLFVQRSKMSLKQTALFEVIINLSFCAVFYVLFLVW